MRAQVEQNCEQIFCKESKNLTEQDSDLITIGRNGCSFSFSLCVLSLHPLAIRKASSAIPLVEAHSGISRLLARIIECRLVICTENCFLKSSVYLVSALSLSLWPYPALSTYLNLSRSFFISYFCFILHLSIDTYIVIIFFSVSSFFCAELQIEGPADKKWAAFRSEWRERKKLTSTVHFFFSIRW